MANGLEETGIIGKRVISAAVAPSDEQRTALDARRQVIRRSFTTQPEANRKIIAALLSGWPSYGAGLPDAKAAVSLICRALDDAPAWAVAVAAERFIKGKHATPWNPEKAPTAPQVRAEVQDVLSPLDAEMARLVAVLDAEVVDVSVTPEQRDDGLARWAKIRADIEAKNGVGGDRNDPEHPERVAMRETNRRFQVREMADDGAGRRMFGKTPMSAELSAQIDAREARERRERQGEAA